YEEVTEALAKYEVIFLKANHNSGPVYRLAETDNKDKIYEAYLNVKRQLSVPFGRFNGELWYDDIEPRAFCEKAITTADGEAPPDYKFHVFNSSAGQKIILQYDYDRFSDHARTMFDSE